MEPVGVACQPRAGQDGSNGGVGVVSYCKGVWLWETLQQTGEKREGLGMKETWCENSCRRRRRRSPSNGPLEGVARETQCMHLHQHSNQR